MTEESHEIVSDGTVRPVAVLKTGDEVVFVGRLLLRVDEEGQTTIPESVSRSLNVELDPGVTLLESTVSIDVTVIILDELVAGTLMNVALEAVPKAEPVED